MRIFYSILFICLSNMLWSQGKVNELIESRIVKSVAIESVEPFQLKKLVEKTNLISSNILEDFEVLDLNKKFTSNILGQKNNVLSVVIPIDATDNIDLELVKVDITTSEFKLFAASNSANPFNYKIGAHYWGRVKGQSNSLVALSVFDDEITGTINYGNQSLSLVKLQDKDAHILYKEKDLKDKPTFSCFSDEVENIVNSQKQEPISKMAGEDNVVRQYVEVDNDIFRDFGTMQATSDYIMAVYNQVAILYANDAVNFEVNEMIVWDVTDPYTGPSSGNFLDQFRSRLNGVFNGDLAHLIGNSGGGGVAYVDVLCTQGTAGVAYSGINNTFENVPTYSWTVNVITHEVGHNLGSRHTHNCSWNGNNTPIDGCGPAAGFSEGCNGPIPQEGGTIMSYCHLNAVGINLNLGFGPQPGDLIRGRVYNAPCLTANDATCNDGIQNGDEEGIDCGGSNCEPCVTEPTCDDGIQNGDEEGIDCGGTNCEPCQGPCGAESEVMVTINFDNYPEETSWEIRNSNNEIVANGGTYADQTDGSTLVIDVCLGDGCYSFIILDSVGDGLCCSYGEGSYSVNHGESILASGADFINSESTAFCLGDAVNPTCDDGVQNGSETGVDCGGPDCAPCTTCNDGIQNGDETGIDCGGSCAPCTSCNDGIQNGSETGVDCGGPDCAPCTTCNDGIQNGDETGVDCGGSCDPCVSCNDGVQNGSETDVDCGGPDCPACPTCDDGIQNGDETGIDCGGSCAPCDQGCQGAEVTVSITFDDYPEETSWSVTNASGSIVANGGPYGSAADGSSISLTECLPVGCYTFTIADSYGDGICCTYGDGSYSVELDGSIVGNGSSFDDSASVMFCVDGGGSTCNDGVQNGDETGVDCGGSCMPCDQEPTCEDGIQNGDETGIDCGGSCIPCGDCTFNVISSVDFESGLSIWNDGGSDCRRSSLDAAYANSGDYCVRLRDNSTSSVLRSDNLSLANASKVLIDFSFITRSLESSEGFYLEMSTNSGNTYAIVREWRRNTDFEVGERYNETVEVDGQFNNTTRFRFRCDASTNSDWVYLDDIVIRSCSDNTGSGVESDPIANVELRKVSPDFQVDIFPNPADLELNVVYNLAESKNVRFAIFDIAGRLIREGTIVQSKGKQEIDIATSGMTNGLYHLMVDAGGTRVIKKFVVTHR